VTVGLLKAAILGAGAGVTHVLVDGFPRSLDNMTSWNNVVGNEIPVCFLLYFKLSEEEMMKRIMARAANSVVKRSDDNEETIKKRLGVFKN